MKDFFTYLWPSQNIWTLKPILYSYYIPPKSWKKRMILSFEGFDHARHVSRQGKSNNIRYVHCHRWIFHITICIILIPYILGNISWYSNFWGKWYKLEPNQRNFQISTKYVLCLLKRHAENLSKYLFMLLLVSKYVTEWQKFNFFPQNRCWLFTASAFSKRIFFLHWTFYAKQKCAEILLAF